MKIAVPRITHPCPGRYFITLFVDNLAVEPAVVTDDTTAAALLWVIVPVPVTVVSTISVLILYMKFTWITGVISTVDNSPKAVRGKATSKWFVTASVDTLLYTPPDVLPTNIDLVLITSE